MRISFQGPLRALLLSLFATLLVASAGCNMKFERDPNKTVTVEIVDIGDDDDVDEVQEILKGMTDGSSHLMSSSRSGDQITIRLSPVRDVEKFSRNIKFGKVTEVDGRTVKVQFIR